MIEKDAAGVSAESNWYGMRLRFILRRASLGTHKEPEVVACQLGIFMDFMGPEASPGGSLSWEEYEGIVKDFPRLKVIVGIRKIMCGLCKTKPETTYDNFVGTYGEKYVEGYSLEGKKMVDILESSNLPDSF